jgi:hypothetical protein
MNLNQSTTPACPVSGCKAKTPHVNDSTVQAFMRQSPAEVFAAWFSSQLEIGNEEDNASRRVDPMCAARPLSDHDIERIIEGRRLADSMNEEPR